MDITFSALQYIVEVARTKSISQAAKNFYLSQPHLSNTIRAVEREYGISLFQRSSKGVELSEAGKKFVMQAQEILKQVNRLEEDLLGEPGDRLWLNISMTRSYQVIRELTNLINENQDKPKFHLRICETNPFAVMEDVRSGVSDLGVLHFYDTQEHYFFHCLKAYRLTYESSYKRRFLVAMSMENPLARVPRIKGEMLNQEIVVLYGDYESQIAPYRFADNLSCISSKRIHVYERATAMDILSRCPHTYTLITGLHPVTLSQYGLVLRRCDDLELYNIGCCIYRNGEALTPAAKAVKEKVMSIDWTERVAD